MTGRRSLYIIVAIFSCFFFFSCQADEENTQTPVTSDYVKKAKSVLQDSIVLYATAMQGTVNKTQLPEGCPLKYYFEWRSEDSLNIQLHNFSVGKMPVTIWFSINCKFMQLNSWERGEYTGDGWIKFEGTNGVTDFTGNSSEYESGTKGTGTVKGFFNVNTNEIEFVTNFNVMNITADVYQQKINPTLIDNYDDLFEQYEKDLAKYKEDHGIQ